MRTRLALMRWLMPLLLLAGSSCGLAAAHAPSNGEAFTASYGVSAIVAGAHGDLTPVGQAVANPAVIVRAVAHQAAECADAIAVVASATTLATGVDPSAVLYALAVLLLSTIAASWWRAAARTAPGVPRRPLFGLIQTNICVLRI